MQVAFLMDDASEFAKLRAFRALCTYAPSCLKLLRACVPLCLKLLRAYVP